MSKIIPIPVPVEVEEEAPGLPKFNEADIPLRIEMKSNPKRVLTNRGRGGNMEFKGSKVPAPQFNRTGHK